MHRVTTDFFAGQLCATHVGCKVQHPDLDDQYRWVLFELRASEKYPTVKVLCRPLGREGDSFALGNLKQLVLEARDVLTVAVR